MIGEYKNAGSDYRATGCPDAVKVHDFADKDLGKVAPYGIYDIAANAGWVSVRIDHDTAAFAVNSIRRWYEAVGCGRYNNADRLLITADGGGLNGSRVRLWKLELQKFADETGLILQVCHCPPGTSSRVDDWRGGVRSGGVAGVRRLSRIAGASFPLNHSPVSSRRSSNRTCRSPASGFHPRHLTFALGRSARRSGKA